MTRTKIEKKKRQYNQKKAAAAQRLRRRRARAAPIQVQMTETNQRKADAGPMHEQSEAKVHEAIAKNMAGSADGKSWVPLRFPAELAVATAQTLLILAAHSLRTWQDAWLGALGMRAVGMRDL